VIGEVEAAEPEVATPTEPTVEAEVVSEVVDEDTVTESESVAEDVVVESDIVPEASDEVATAEVVPEIVESPVTVSGGGGGASVPAIVEEQPVEDAVTPLPEITEAEEIGETTELPTITEELTETGKVVVVASTPEQDLMAPMTDVPVSAEIAEIFRVGQESQIKIKWANNGNQEMDFAASDDDADDTTLSYETQPAEGRKRFTINLSTGAQEAVALQTYDTRTYTISPDGTKKAFLETRDGKNDLFIVDAAGQNEKRVTTLGVLSPAAPVTWDATGRYLSFAVVKDGETALYIVSVGGGEVRKIVDFSADPQSIPYY
jgi:hypothetical protein